MFNLRLMLLLGTLGVVFVAPEADAKLKIVNVKKSKKKTSQPISNRRRSPTRRG